MTRWGGYLALVLQAPLSPCVVSLAVHQAIPEISLVQPERVGVCPVPVAFSVDPIALRRILHSLRVTNFHHQEWSGRGLGKNNGVDDGVHEPQH